MNSRANSLSCASQRSPDKVSQCDNSFEQSADLQIATAQLVPAHSPLRFAAAYTSQSAEPIRVVRSTVVCCATDAMLAQRKLSRAAFVTAELSRAFVAFAVTGGS